ncbi:unnamed protein product [Arctogadus glacialis]
MAEGFLMEVCVDSVESAVNAERGGAARLELCSSLLEGGLTPSVGLLQVVKQNVKVPIYVMIRPRGGDFLYSEQEVEVMRRDIQLMKSNGADGLVLGVLTEDGRVDAELCMELLVLSRPLPVTFHRAFDMVQDPAAALETLVSLGFQRLLTSGCDCSALEGLPVLRRLVQQASGSTGMEVGTLVLRRLVQQVWRSGLWSSGVWFNRYGGRDSGPQASGSTGMEVGTLVLRRLVQQVWRSVTGPQASGSTGMEVCDWSSGVWFNRYGGRDSGPQASGSTGMEGGTLVLRRLVQQVWRSGLWSSGVWFNRYGGRDSGPQASGSTGMEVCDWSSSVWFNRYGGRDSGPQASGSTGMEVGTLVLKRLVQQGSDVITGGGITERNLQRVLEGSRAQEFHCSARSGRDSAMKFRNSSVTMGASFSAPEYGLKVADASKVRNLNAIARNAV